MLRALTAEESRSVEAAAFAAGRADAAALMARAGEAVADAVDSFGDGLRVTVLCGPGNNGGDGWVAARVAATRGHEVRVVSLRDPSRLPDPAVAAAREAMAAGVEWREGGEEPDEALLDADVVVDALLGTGSGLPLRGAVRAWCAAVGRSGAGVVSVDVPTGVDADTGAADPDAIRARVTVALGYPKRGHVLFPGADRAGEVVIADIGLDDPDSVATSAVEVWEPRDLAALVPRPAPDAHKNERGRVLVLAGSGRFPGAAVLAARGAMRAGAGYVTLATPEPVVAIAQAHLLAAPVVGLAAGRSHAFVSAAARQALDLARDHDAVVLGPGLTLTDGAAAFVREVVAGCPVPLVLDADGLNALVDATGLLGSRPAPTVMTPHAGELARLLATSAAAVQADRVSFSARLAHERCAVVLKGAGTVVSDGTRTAVNTSGSVALATAGTGDVLAGVIGALLGAGLGPYEAGVLGAHLHGRAGQVAARVHTPLGVTAEDVPDAIPVAYGELLGTW